MGIFRPFAVALTFLTRTPLVVREVRDVDLGRAVAWFPAVGLVLGAALAGAGRLMHAHVSAELWATAIVTLLVALTAGLHLDGLADVFDGLGGGRGDRERTLEIMRDSRIGSFGAAAVVLVLLAKVFALIEVERRQLTWALWSFPVAARWAVCPLVICFPYARQEGLGKPFNGHARGLDLVFATCVAAAAVSLVGPSSIAPMGAALLAALCVGGWVQRRVGGLTGDVYGAAIELAELAFLIVATSIGE
jgi:adenosylcobinamide-GDP ribazoletransferase